LGVSKAELLSPDSDNVAVRLALAETHVIAETKQYLESEGVCLDAFKSNKERSNTIILIKNIPHSTTIEEIQDLFKPFGNLNRVRISLFFSFFFLPFSLLYNCKRILFFFEY